MNTIT